MTPHARVHILLVEDNAWDARVTREALQASRMAPEVHLVPDGVEAIDFLQRKGRHADAPRPDLIVLDLNLPRKDGREVLAEVKRDPSLARIPLVVLSSSRATQDILQAYDLHANAYVQKPFEPADLPAAIKAIEEFWLVWVQRAPGEA